MAGDYKLKRGVGLGYDADLDDVWMLKHALRQDGYYTDTSDGLTPFPDDGLFEAIKKFQSRKGLQVDGVVKPGGETERNLRQQLLSVAKFRCILCGAWHGGLYSPHICWQCWKKAAS